MTLLPGAAQEEARVSHQPPRVQDMAVHVVPMKSVLQSPGTQRLKLKYDKQIPRFAFSFNLHPCAKVPGGGGADDVNFMGIITNRKEDEAGGVLRAMLVELS